MYAINLEIFVHQLLYKNDKYERILIKHTSTMHVPFVRGEKKEKRGHYVREAIFKVYTVDTEE